MLTALLAAPRPLLAQPASAPSGGEASLVLPDLSSVDFLGVNGSTLLMSGLAVCALGLLFGLATFTQLKNLPVHSSMREVSELIYETCKTYLITQGKFILLLWAFIAVIIAAYFGWLAPIPDKSVAVTLPIILLFSLIGIAAATASRGSASASTRSPTRGLPSRACAASRSRSTPSRCAPA
jgi:K(+)-stimulated pyrophosphate-energized sodium pump